MVRLGDGKALRLDDLDAVLRQLAKQRVNVDHAPRSLQGAHQRQGLRRGFLEPRILQVIGEVQQGNGPLRIHELLLQRLVQRDVQAIRRPRYRRLEAPEDVRPIRMPGPAELVAGDAQRTPHLLLTAAKLLVRSLGRLHGRPLPALFVLELQVVVSVFRMAALIELDSEVVRPRDLDHSTVVFVVVVRVALGLDDFRPHRVRPLVVPGDDGVHVNAPTDQQHVRLLGQGGDIINASALLEDRGHGSADLHERVQVMRHGEEADGHLVPQRRVLFLAWKRDDARLPEERLCVVLRGLPDVGSARDAKVRHGDLVPEPELVGRGERDQRPHAILPGQLETEARRRRQHADGLGSRQRARVVGSGHRRQDPRKVHDNLLQDVLGHGAQNRVSARGLGGHVDEHVERRVIRGVVILRGERDDLAAYGRLQRIDEDLENANVLRLQLLQLVRVLDLLSGNRVGLIPAEVLQPQRRLHRSAEAGGMLPHADAEVVSGHALGVQLGDGKLVLGVELPIDVDVDAVLVSSDGDTRPPIGDDRRPGRELPPRDHPTFPLDAAFEAKPQGGAHVSKEGIHQVPLVLGHDQAVLSHGSRDPPLVLILRLGVQQLHLRGGSEAGVLHDARIVVRLVREGLMAKVQPAAVVFAAGYRGEEALHPVRPRHSVLEPATVRRLAAVVVRIEGFLQDVAVDAEEHPASN
mmetsp:Transcript_14844/g.56166  ORF Transcript_14844/g.56166 Transcript_14844/m.56166 type:complete len:692 (+) Transcript_14844:13850-15925(+)